VVTVAADGVATAVGNGAATVTGTHEGASGDVELTVQQVADSISVTPTAPVLTVEGTVELWAEAVDANGNTVVDASFTWTSSDESVATVDTAGVVTGVAEGEAQVIASSGDATGSAAVTVTAAAFEPSEDVTVEGSLSAASITVPAGVTVTLTSGATLTSAGPVEIGGTLVGDCVAAAVVAGGDLSVTGTVSNACADSAAASQDLTLLAGGAITLEGAVLRSGGDIHIDNTGGASTAPASWGSGWARASHDDDCTYRDVDIGARDVAPRGVDGSPAGGNGQDGRSVRIFCAGTATLAGAKIQSGVGGSGGRGTSHTEVTALGGRGGDGGEIVIWAGGDVLFTEGNQRTASVLQLGSGGSGGWGRADGSDPEAEGGDGGAAGLPEINAGGIIRFSSFGVALMQWSGGGGDGGPATAVGDRGADATETVAAEKGASVTGRGGKGGSYGFPDRQTLVMGDLLRASAENPSHLMIQFGGLSPQGGEGGSANLYPGRGGQGSAQFKDGADGGDVAGRGGDAGPLTVFDNRGAGTYRGGGGSGGSLYIGFVSGGYGRGGDGWSDCVVGSIQPGGTGGSGGVVVAGVGGPSAQGTGFSGSHGEVQFADFGNGGDGGDGQDPGVGGAPADVALVLGAVGSLFTPGLQPGSDGTGCSYSLAPTASVTDDKNGHAPYIALAPSGLTVTLDAEGAITISGDGNWVTVQGTVDADGSFQTTGVGTVAGYNGVTVTFTGTLALDEGGRVAGIASGELIMDALNAVLPENSDGVRNPATYSVTATLSSG
jgi:hypothetical protein